MLKEDLERRRRRRVKIQLPVRLDYNDSESLALTKNISLLGTCLQMDREILPGTRVALSLDIPKYVDNDNLIGEIRGEGAVVRCSPLSEQETKNPNYELGIFFSSFSSQGEEKLFSYLDYVAKKEEEEVRNWVEQYRAHIKKRKLEISKKKQALARKRAAKLAKKAKKAQKSKENAKSKTKHSKA